MIEGGYSVGSHNTAPYPTEVFMMSQATCTAVDVIELLKKMRQPLQHPEISLDGQCENPRFPIVHTYSSALQIYGDIKSLKAEKAISLSITKYCTMTKMIDHIATITYSFEIIIDPSITSELQI